MTDIPNEHHNIFILNQIHDMYMTSSLKFMDEIFRLLSDLFVYQMLKNMYECPYPNCGSVIKSLRNKCIIQESI